MKLLKFYESLLVYCIAIIVFLGSLFYGFKDLGFMLEGICASFVIAIITTLVTDFNNKSHLI